jgi:hybrid cluster-associated redox disulfide protein
MENTRRFNEQTPLTEVIEADKRYSQILMTFGLHCFGCPLTAYETIEEAAAVHGIDIDFLLEKLNEDLDD